MNNSRMLVSGVAAVLRQFRSFGADKQRAIYCALAPSAVASVLLFSTVAAASDAVSIVKAEARNQGVPVTFALQIARVESGVRCGLRNRRSTASGPLQILKGSARAMGYRGDIRHASCATQTHYGMKHLAMCYRAAHGNQRLAKRCHQQGIAAIYKRRRK